jgi:murein DD-endopeptidase MepM/ murein hydrolase activator NlpD
MPGDAGPELSGSPADSEGSGSLAREPGRGIFAPDGPGGIPGEAAVSPRTASSRRAQAPAPLSDAVRGGDPLPAEPALQEGLFATEARVRAASLVTTRTVSEGGTLTQALDSLGLSQDESNRALEAMTREGALADLRRGGTVTVVRAPEHRGGTIERIEFQGGGQVRPVTLIPGGPNGFMFFSSAAPKLDLQIAFRGTVREAGGFLEAFTDAGLSAEAATELADLLSTQIDFLSDVRAGDSFQLLYRSSWEEERLMDDPVLLMISVVNLDRKLEFFRRDGRRGAGAFYDMEFRSVKKPFLVSPLQYNLVAPLFPDAERLSIPKSESGGNVRYGAPQGVPVVAVASGTVRFTGRRGGFGNLVVVSHDEGGYETFYAHLSGFAPGIETGARIREGQVIGKVGMTGATLGPVLDFRLYRGGQSLDLRQELSELRGDMLDVELRADFAELVGRRRVALHNLLALEAL